MACRKNSIDNEQDNIMYFATFVVYLPPKRTNKRVDSKNNIKPIKYIKLMKKLFTLVCGVLFAMFANAATLDIGGQATM